MLKVVHSPFLPSTKRFYIILLLILLPLVNQSGAFGETFIETFDTTTYNDALNTTAWWNSDAGELSLYPYVLEPVGGIDGVGDVRDVKLAGDHAFLAVEEGGFKVLDISDPTMPKYIGGIPDIEFPFGLDLAGDHAFVAAMNRFVVVDITDPALPEIEANIDGLSGAYDVALAGDFAYVASGNSGLLCVDITIPSMPVVVGGVDTPGFASSVVLYGDHAYLCDGYHGIAVIDISNPPMPQLINQIPASYHPENICIAGHRAYVAEISGELLIYALDNPDAPMLLGACTMPGHVQDVDVDGIYAYVTIADNDTTGFCAVDVSDPLAPRIIGSMVPPGFPVGVVTAGQYAFVNCFYQGVQVVRIADPVEPMMVADLSGVGNIRDMVIDDHIACLLTSGPNNDTFLTVSLADPSFPQIIGSLDPPSGGIKLVVSGHYAYVTAGSFGLTVIDIHDLANPTVVAGLEIDGQAIYIEQSGNFLYLGVMRVIDCHLIIVDISDPLAPAQVAELMCYSTPHDIVRSGDYLFIPEHEDGATRITDICVYDISDPVATTRVASYHLSEEFVQKVYIEGDVLYACYFIYLGGTNNGVQLFDISDPLNMQPLGRYQGPVNYGDLCVIGDLGYLSTVASDRLDVLDLSDPLAPVLIESVNVAAHNSKLGRAGDFLFSAGWAGFHSIQVFDRLVNDVDNVAQSLPLPATDEDILMVRLETVAQPTVCWEFSADGGDHWQSLLANGHWELIEYTGSVPLWRSTMAYTTIGVPPTVDQLELEWTCSVLSTPEALPGRFSLGQNTPNPFNPQTTINYELPQANVVTLRVFNLAGELVDVLVEGENQPAGRHTQRWNGHDSVGNALPSGTYFYRLEAGGYSETRRMLLVR